MVARPWVVAALLSVTVSAAADAQTRRASMLPAETPPDSYFDSQYVDSRGCAFVRAGLNGQVTWLPLFDENRQPLCGLDPTLGGGAGLPGRVVIRTQPEADAPSPPAGATPPVTETTPTQPAPQTAGVTPGTPPAPPPAAPAEATAGPAPAPTAPPPGVATGAGTGPVVIVAAGDRTAAPRYTLRVIERRGTIIEVAPDPHARSPLTVIEQRGLIFYPDA